MTKFNSLEEFNNYQQELIKENKKFITSNTIINIGMATCGISSGADVVYEEFKSLTAGENIEIRKTGCLGKCYMEPIVEVKNKSNVKRYYNVTKEDVPTILESISIKHKENYEFVGETRIALENSGLINPEDINDYILHEGYSALSKVLFVMGRENTLEEIKNSGLRGRGGAGFPTGLKWEAVKNQDADIKYVICNADEGDPGAFMDRALLESDPFRIIEAMTIAGYTVGATSGIIYVRAEYPLAVKRLELAIKQATDYGLLGDNILGSGFSFTIDINLGAGAFVCGEETALLSSVEGGRGEPRVKPPFPAEAGLYNKPTNINNVETYANIPPIILKGADWFKTIGTESSKGTKVFALAGKINNIGLVEVPMGTTLRNIIYDIGGGIKDNKEFKAVQTGGPSGGCIPASFLDTAIDYESLTAAGSMMGSGGMIVMDEDDCMVDIAKFYLDFSLDESCGKCAPCRIGNVRLQEILARITTGSGEEDDLDTLESLGNIIKDTALCGLGGSSPNPVLSTIKHFRDEYITHIKDKKCPAHKCRALIKYFINPEVCIGCTKCANNCPVPCIEGEVKKNHKIREEKCIKCGRCYELCPVKAIGRE